jgi:hypothetical protein
MKKDTYIGYGRPTEKLREKPIPQKVYRMRQAGQTYTQIGAALGFSRQRAAFLYARVERERKGLK